MRLIKAAGLRNEFEKISNMVQKDKSISVREVGMGLIFSTIEGLSGTASEKAFYEFIASPLEMSASEIETMEIFELAEKIKEYIDTYDKEKLESFFKSVSVSITMLN